MNRKFEIGDNVVFNERSPEEDRGKKGKINKYIVGGTLEFRELKQGEIVSRGLPKLEPIMYEVKLENTKRLRPAAEDWLDKIE